MTRNTLEQGGKSESVMESTAFNENYNQSDCDIECADQDDLPQSEYSQPADHRVIDAVESNTHLLQQLMEQVACLQESIASDASPIASVLETSQAFSAENDSESDYLRDQIEELKGQVAELEPQNSDLASQVASSNIQEVVSTNTNGSGSSETLSWEDRKQMILEQMEADSFDAEAFVSSLQSETTDETDATDETECKPEDPFEFVERLSAEVARLTADLKSREDEVHELRCLLDDQSETRGGGIAIGAAAIAGMMDEDDLVVEERERLRVLQEEWEEKFRQGGNRSFS